MVFLPWNAGVQTRLNLVLLSLLCSTKLRDYLKGNSSTPRCWPIFLHCNNLLDTNNFQRKDLGAGLMVSSWWLGGLVGLRPLVKVPRQQEWEASCRETLSCDTQGAKEKKKGAEFPHLLGAQLPQCKNFLVDWAFKQRAFGPNHTIPFLLYCTFLLLPCSLPYPVCKGRGIGCLGVCFLVTEGSLVSHGFLALFLECPPHYSRT